MSISERKYKLFFHLQKKLYKKRLEQAKKYEAALKKIVKYRGVCCEESIDRVCPTCIAADALRE